MRCGFAACLPLPCESFWCGSVQNIASSSQLPATHSPCVGVREHAISRALVPVLIHTEWLELRRVSFLLSLSCAVAVCLWACLLIGSAVATPITYEEVTVGNPGNANDTGGTGNGAVAYEYKIGKYDVTIGQYTSFF